MVFVNDLNQKEKENKWASSRESLSSEFPTKWDLNQPAHVQVLARKLKFRS